MITTVLLVKYDGGWREVTLPAAVDLYGRREAVLQLGGVTDPAVVDRVGLALLDIVSRPKQSTAIALEAIEGSTPYLDFDKGDTITVEGDPFRVVGITVTEDDEGNPVYVPELEDAVTVAAAKVNRWITSLTDGALSGRVSSANPSNPGGPTRQNPRILSLATWSGGGELVAGVESARKAVRYPCRMNLATAVLVNPGATDTDIAIAVNGTAIDAFTIPAGEERIGYEMQHDVDASMHVSIIVLTAGTGASGLSVEIAASTI